MMHGALQGQMGAFGNYQPCTLSHPPADVEKHARTRLAEIEQEMPRLTTQLAELAVEKSRIEKMLAAIAVTP
jgi:hypothetical protein